MAVVLISRNIEYRYDMVFIAYFDISNVDLKNFKINYDICKKELSRYDYSLLHTLLLSLNS